MGRYVCSVRRARVLNILSDNRMGCAAASGNEMLLVPGDTDDLLPLRLERPDESRVGYQNVRCDACGFHLGRDLNAGRTILATAEHIRAGVDDVRHLRPPRGMESMRSESEIPRL